MAVEVTARSSYTLKLDEQTRDALVTALGEYLTNHNDGVMMHGDSPAYRVDDPRDPVNQYNALRLLRDALQNVDEHRYVKSS